MSAPVNFTVTKIERRLATQTLEAIDKALLVDGGNRYRQLLRQTLPRAEDAYREVSSEFRSHLGASQIGRECARDLWYGFRWATSNGDREEYHTGSHTDNPCVLCSQIKARMIRLLNRGHLEEARFIALLQMIGCEVWTQDQNGKQFQVSLHNGHFGGSCDSVIRGIPEMPDEAILAEMKTSNDANFSKLVSEGLRNSKFEHYVQMQIYMGGLNLSNGLYLVTNKDTDQLYAEIVEFNKEFYDSRVERARLVVLATQPPKKISESPSWFKCKFCNSRGVCHKLPIEGVVPLPVKNCRTCLYSRIQGADWICTNRTMIFGKSGPPRKFEALSKEEQLAGCDLYTAIEM